MFTERDLYETSSCPRGYEGGSVSVVSSDACSPSPFVCHNKQKNRREEKMSVLLTYSNHSIGVMASDSKNVRKDTIGNILSIDDEYRKIYLFPKQRAIMGFAGLTTFQTSNGLREFKTFLEAAEDCGDIYTFTRNLARTISGSFVYGYENPNTSIHLLFADDKGINMSVFDINRNKYVEHVKCGDDMIMQSGINRIHIDDGMLTEFRKHPEKSAHTFIHQSICIEESLKEIPMAGGEIQGYVLMANGEIRKSW